VDVARGMLKQLDELAGEDRNYQYMNGTLRDMIARYDVLVSDVM